MNHYAIFRNFITTANPDNTIPLNAKFVGEIVEENPHPAEIMVAQANVANDLFAALHSVTRIIESRSTSPTYALQLSTLLPSLNEALAKARAV